MKLLSFKSIFIIGAQISNVADIVLLFPSLRFDGINKWLRSGVLCDCQLQGSGVGTHEASPGVLSLSFSQTKCGMWWEVM